MSELAQVKATIPKDLKRKAFATFALHDEKFNRWLERELRAFIPTASFNSLPNVLVRKSAVTARSWLT